ncbi:hypothetical protein pipiens_015090 [Culex pipiens pipiens]|uniref:Transcriptional coactivator p15 (PC4) C-terminal domain-containing protein n=1 Tax=Culex pipiens pipiens TaxID=38569 RepID=A0ABD1CRX5_CULPP
MQGTRRPPSGRPTWSSERGLGCSGLVLPPASATKMPKNKKKEETSDSDSGPEDRTPAKKSKSEAGSSGGAKNESGEPEWFLDKNKKVTVREFKNKVYVDIREFYEKDGKMLPGKKGVSLQVPMWKKLLEISDEVNEAIKKF